MKPAEVDGVLVQWGDRLFYPGNRKVRTPPGPAGGVGRRAAEVRRQIEATFRCSPQVMVKVTGGGRGMRAIAAHFRYISRNGKLEIEDDRGVTREGKQALRDLGEQWRHAGSFIEETSHRRDAFNVMLSMPRGVDALTVQRAAREFAKAEFPDHRYVMALHDDQANPHVHLSVRAESRQGRRLNPRKADLQRWRETFAEKLRGWGIEAAATRQATRGEIRNFEPLWSIKAAEEGRLRSPRKQSKSGLASERRRKEALVAWTQIVRGLASSDDPGDRALAERVARYVRATPFAVEYAKHLDKRREATRLTSEREPSRVAQPAEQAPALRR